MVHNERMPFIGEVQKIVTIARTLAELRNLRSHEHWSREQIERKQTTDLGQLREFAYTHSRFYQTFHKGLKDAPLEALPVLTKSMIMDHFDEFVTDRSVHLDAVRNHVARGSIGRLNNTYEVVTTSGSTGNPGIFLYNEEEWVTVLASFARAREWAGVHLNLTKRSKMAVVSSTNDQNMSARVAKSADTPFIPTIRLDATDPMQTIVTQLNSWNPEVLVAYASMAHELALQQQEGKLTIHPKKVFTSSEVLTAAMRHTLEQSWGNVNFNEYAATEAATIAAEDEMHHGLHVFEDLLILENVNGQNKPVPPGEFGEKLLVTVLFSRTQPLIRYEITDSVRFAPNDITCSLPYRIIDGIQGRQEDMLLIQGIQIHPNVFHDIMDATPNKGWRVIQEKHGLLILVVNDDETDHKKIELGVTSALQKRGIHIPVTIENVDAIPKAKSGKSPLVQAYKEGR